MPPLLISRSFFLLERGLRWGPCTAPCVLCPRSIVLWAGGKVIAVWCLFKPFCKVMVKKPFSIPRWKIWGTMQYWHNAVLLMLLESDMWCGSSKAFPEICLINKLYEKLFTFWILYFACHFFLISFFPLFLLGGSESGRSTPSLSMYSDSKSSPSLYPQAPRHFHVPGRHSSQLLSSLYFGCMCQRCG